MVRSPRRVVTAALAVFAMLGAAAAVHAQEPIQATVDRTMVRINESFTLVLRAEGPVRGEPETAPLAAQFDILELDEQPPHRHRQHAGDRGQRVAIPADAEVRRRLHDSAAARRRSANDRGQRARAGARPRRDGRRRHLHGARRGTGRRLRAVADPVHAAALRRRQHGARDVDGARDDGRRGHRREARRGRGVQDDARRPQFRRPRAALCRVPAASRDADDRPRDVRSHGDPRPRLLARAAFSFRRARARGAARRRAAGGARRPPRGCRRSKSR